MKCVWPLCTFAAFAHRLWAGERTQLSDCNWPRDSFATHSLIPHLLADGQLRRTHGQLDTSWEYFNYHLGKRRKKKTKIQRRTLKAKCRRLCRALWPCHAPSTHAPDETALNFWLNFLAGCQMEASEGNSSRMRQMLFGILIPVWAAFKKLNELECWN